MPRSLARVPPLRNLRRINFAPAARYVAPPTAPAGAGCPVPFPNAGGLRADRDPYANPEAPYMATRVQASGKFPEPILNTPKIDHRADKGCTGGPDSTTLKSAVLNTAGVTLGTGEGGNASATASSSAASTPATTLPRRRARYRVSVHKKFFTEQVESCADRVRPLRAAAPPAARSTS